MTARVRMVLGFAVLVVGLVPYVGRPDLEGRRGEVPASLGAQAQAPATFESTTARTWKALHDKILVMAKDTQFPDDKLAFKPHPDSRSVLDEFRHVTLGLEMSTAQLKGQPFDYTARTKATSANPTRARQWSQKWKAPWPRRMPRWIRAPSRR